uniref:(northern house mosquito) hypothetical protein n=1 Tax=Culex pipiens TaxID=7175 RepID=A0A8D8NX04_CULPI
MIPKCSSTFPRASRRTTSITASTTKETPCPADPRWRTSWRSSGLNHQTCEVVDFRCTPRSRASYCCDNPRSSSSTTPARASPLYPSVAGSRTLCCRRWPSASCPSSRCSKVVITSCQIVAKRRLELG